MPLPHQPYFECISRYQRTVICMCQKNKARLMHWGRS